MKRLLALLCCLWLAIIAAEVSHGAGNSQISQRTANAPQTVAQATKRVAPAAHSLDQWQAVILGRPLFTPDRRPAASSVAADAGLPRLSGIIASPSDVLAIFQPAGNVKPVVLRDGETVSGWEVTAIAGSAVSLRKAADRLVLRPEFGNSKAGAAANDVKQPRPRWEAPAATGLLRARWSNAQLQP